MNTQYQKSLKSNLSKPSRGKKEIKIKGLIMNKKTLKVNTITYA
jgi:hypothetical protein